MVSNDRTLVIWWHGKLFLCKIKSPAEKEESYFARQKIKITNLRTTGTIFLHFTESQFRCGSLPISEVPNFRKISNILNTSGHSLGFEYLGYFYQHIRPFIWTHLHRNLVNLPIPSKCLTVNTIEKLKELWTIQKRDGAAPIMSCPNPFWSEMSRLIIPASFGEKNRRAREQYVLISAWKRQKRDAEECCNLSCPKSNLSRFLAHQSKFWAYCLIFSVNHKFCGFQISTVS